MSETDPVEVFSEKLNQVVMIKGDPQWTRVDTRVFRAVLGLLDSVARETDSDWANVASAALWRGANSEDLR